MSAKLSCRLLVGALAVAGAMSSAQAALVQVEGAHVTFFYDSDFWGAGSASVSGDAIRFAVDPAYSLAATVAAGGAPALSQHTESAAQALTVVAKSGYAVNYGVSTTYGGTYSVAPGGDGSNSIAISGGGGLTGGSYAGGAYTASTGEKTYGGGIQLGSGTSGTISQTDTLPAAAQSFQALQAGALLRSALSLNAEGSSAVAFQSYAYQFNTTAVAAVPEPATYGMLLGGLGMLGLIARRRKAAPK